MAKLLGYDFDIIYEPGITNRAAGALSRVVVDGELMVVSIPYWAGVEDVRVAVEKDVALQQIIQKLKEQPNEPTPHSSSRDQLLHKEQLVLPAASEWVERLIAEYHNSSIGGIQEHIVP